MAQLARATGSYPVGHGFKSNSRYQNYPSTFVGGYIWPVGQEVKTPPFHGSNMGSIPVRVTKKDNIRTKRFGCYLFIQAAGLAWNQCACALYGIAKGVWHHAQACIRVSLRLNSIRDFVAIPYRNKLRIPSTATP